MSAGEVWFTDGQVEEWPDDWPSEPTAWCPACQRWIGLSWVGWKEDDGYERPDSGIYPCTGCGGELEIALRPVPKEGYDWPGPELP
jgi:hypothetical protein